MTPAEHYGAWSGRIGLWAPPSQLTHAALSTPAVECCCRTLIALWRSTKTQVQTKRAWTMAYGVGHHPVALGPREGQRHGVDGRATAHCANAKSVRMRKSYLYRAASGIGARALPWPRAWAAAGATVTCRP